MTQSPNILSPDDMRRGLPVLPNPVEAQREASDPRSSVWVNASAGSGKTTVLTNRVLRLLLGGVKPQKILCLTFTRAAAAEMSIRVMERLSFWAICTDPELDEEFDRLQNAPPIDDQRNIARRLFAQVLACPGGMRIRTIHAFCQEVLGRFPIEAGLPPHFAVIEDIAAEAMFVEAQRDLLRAAANAPDGELARALDDLIATIGGNAFTDGMRRFVHDRERFDQARQKCGGLAGVTAELAKAFGLDADETAASCIDAATDLANFPSTALRHAAECLLTDKKTYAERGRKILDWLTSDAPQRAAAFDAYCGCFLTKEGEPFSKHVGADHAKRYPDLADKLTAEAARLMHIWQRRDLLKIKQTTHALMVCAAVMIDTISDRKQRQAVLDYNDLIIRTLALLRRPGIAPWVLYKLDGGLDHIMVDEAQDTSRAQWEIVSALVEEFFSGRGSRDGTMRTLFVVGDEKQSIYSFQRADPEAFLSMRAYFSEKIRVADRMFNEVPMHVSFRSAPAILRAVDQVFRADAARNGVSETPVRHSAYDAAKSGRVEIWPLQPAPVSAKTDQDWQVAVAYEDDIDPEAELADKIAATVKGWLDRGDRLPGADRPIMPGDVMVLLRRRGRFADLMVRALKKRKIPVTGVDRMRLVRQLPVMDILALLQFALLPEDDLTLATVLRGPLLGLDEDRLMQIAAYRKDGLWPALQAASAGHPDVAAAVAYLSQWLAEADFVAPFAMIADILNRPCPADARGGRRALWARLGPDALDPIDELLNAAQEFSRTYTPSLQCFLHWLHAANAEIKRELASNAGQVRIMTVHASKGLEAPIVFLPDTVAMPGDDKIDKLLWADAGDADLPVYMARKPLGGLPKRLREAAHLKQLQEYRRLLYVALTRAVNRLYITGWETGRTPGGAADNWYNLVKSALEPLHEPASVDPAAPQALVVIADPLLKPPAKSKAKRLAAEKRRAAAALPAWALTAATVEEKPLPAVVPSQGSLTPPPADKIQAEPSLATPDDAFTRGRLIHRMLQSLPDLAPDQRPAAAARFLANPQHALTAKQRQFMAAEVLALMDNPAYAPLFGPDSRAEIPLAGTINGQPVSGQVDRLCVRDNEIWIVDYKTNRPPPTSIDRVPDVYRRQLSAYRLVLTAIYPGKTIRCFLLWTYAPLLMELPAAMLEPLN